MKKRILALLMTSILVVSAFTACGDKDDDGRQRDRNSSRNSTKDSIIEVEPTPEPEELTLEDICDKAKLVSYDNYDISLNLVFDFDMEASGMKVNLAMDADIDGAMEITGSDSSKSYLSGDMNISMTEASGALDNSESQSMEMYTVTEDGTTTTYERKDGQAWSSESKAATNGNGSVTGALTDVFTDSFVSKATLEDGTEEVNGEDCYVISYTGNVNELAEILGTSANMDDMSALTSVDAGDMYDKMVATVKIYIDEDEYKFTKMSFDFGDTDIAAMFEADGNSLKDSGIDSVSLNEFYIDITLSNFGKATVNEPTDLTDTDTSSYTSSSDVDINDYLGAAYQLSDKQKNMSSEEYLLDAYDADTSDYTVDELLDMRSITVNEDAKSYFESYFRYYTIDDFVSEAYYWDYMSDDEKEGYAAVAYLMDFPVDCLSAAGADQKELQDLIDNNH